MNSDVVFDKLEGQDSPKDLVELLQLRTGRYSDQNVYNFIHGENKPVDRFTYGELERHARALGAALQAINAQGTRVIILCKPSLHYMVAYWGCLFAGAIAVPAFPPVTGRLDKTLPRIEAIMEDCEPAIALATSDLIGTADKLAGKSNVFRKIRWVAVDQLDLSQGDNWQPLRIESSDIAFLQYTSGSTSTPKGVIVNHGNLIHNSRASFRSIQGANHFVSWLPPYHDMGLIGNIIQVVYGAGRGHFMAPTTFLRYPALWLQTLTRTGATLSVAPNFGYEYCVNKITDTQLDQLDLRNWKHALSGAEPVRAATLDAFSRRFAPAGFDYKVFQTCYGLAEATLLVSGGKSFNGVRRLRLNQRDLETDTVTFLTDDTETGIESVACGHPADSTEIAIVDPETLIRCNHDAVGEIWVNSPSVAEGYWNRPDISKGMFRATIVGEKDKSYLRTGDLGFIDEQGELHITGRRKDLIVLRGRNLYPNDIESITQNAYADYRGKVVAFGIEVDEREELVVIMEGINTDKDRAAALVAEARKLLADEPLELTPYAILVVRSGAIPQTSSGKLQRHSARNQFFKLELNPTIASVLSNDDAISHGAKVDAEAFVNQKLRQYNRTLAVHENTLLKDLGFDYPKLVTLTRELQHKLGVCFSLSSLLMKPSVGQLISSASGEQSLKNTKLSTITDITSGAEQSAPSHCVFGAVELENWLIDKLADRLDVPAKLINPDLPFASMGLDSVGSVELAQSLSKLMHINVPETLAWDAPSLRAATDYLVKLQNSSQHDVSTNAGSVSVVNSDQSGDTTSKPDDEAIAIVGIGCRFPAADDIESFWNLLVDGRDAVSMVPPNRWPQNKFKTTKTGRSVSEWGGFLDQIDGFEPQFFGLSNREVQRMDPQQRLLLEVAWEALEHAGINPKLLAGSQTGVFVGIGHQEYWTLQLGNVQDLDIHSCTGNSQSIAANRISYSLDLRGPSMAIDTACSGSLVGVHLACQSLKSGESSMALAGGVNLMIKPDLTIAFSEAQMLSPTGRCSTFDESADGYVRGEGCGVIVLQRLSDAIRSHSSIIAVIEGSAVLHDGRSNGLTAPNPQAQEAVIKRALATSGLHASDIGYVEAHGTGTPLGDPIEARVLSNIYGASKKDKGPCLIGSVKTNIGHLESAAGIAGLIKAALSVERQYIPPHLHYSKPNSKIDWHNSGLKVADQGQVWMPEEGQKLGAAVSSFGFGGTVAHVILSSQPDELPETLAVNSQEDEDDWQLLILSAREKASLDKQIANYQHHINSQSQQTLGDICYTAAVGRAPLSKRLAIVGRNKNEILAALDHERQHLDKIEGSNPQDVGQCVFCFSGQGSQYVGMAADLIAHEVVFASVIERCNAIINPSLGHSLFDLLGKNTRIDLLKDTRILQPTLYALQCALAQLWMSWGVRPQIVLGHSLGEFAAMQVAGIISLEDGLQLIDARARAMSAQPKEGGMAACVGDLTHLKASLKEYEGRLWVAAYNSPNNLVVAGFNSALKDFAQRDIPDLVVKPLRVSNGFHSPLIEGAVTDLRAFADTISFKTPRIACISNLSGRLFDTAPTSDHFCQHLCQPVDFQGSIKSALELGGRTLIEIGPGRSLLNFARSQAESIQQNILCLPSLQEAKPERKILLESLARYWKHGGQVDWEQLHQHKERKRVHMPIYPFTRTQHWHESVSQKSTEIANESSAGSDKAKTLPLNQASSPMTESVLDIFRSQNTILRELVGSGGHMQKESIFTSGIGSVIEEEMTPAVAIASVHSDNESYTSIADRVKEHIAKIAGCIATDIASVDCLNANLGLDSLMRIELDRIILSEWPKLKQTDRTTLSEDPSVEELVGIIARSQNITQTTSVTTIKEDSSADHSIKNTGVIPEIDFEQSEAYLDYVARLNLINAVGENPYGRIHQGFNGSHSKLDDKPVLNFASFNYSSLSNHPEVCAAAKKAIDTYGTSPSATPLLFGETPLHLELEAEIASYLGTEASVVFASGHSTSVAVIGHIMDQEDLIIHDQYIHDCAIRGAIMSGAKRRSFSHDNWEELDRVLTKIRGYYRRVLIIIEGVYSQDGDIGNLPEFIKIKKKHQCMLMIDEAHSIGVLGETGAGAGEYFGVDRRDVDIWMGTLSKGLGSCGGYIASTKNFIQFLKYTTPLLIFSTGITPSNAAAALQSIRVLRKNPDRVLSLQQKSSWFLERAKALGFDTGPSFDSPIIPIIVGSFEKAMILSNMLKSKNINVMPIGYPAVDKDKCRLRFFVNIEHTEEELEFALQSLKQAILEFRQNRECQTEILKQDMALTTNTTIFEKSERKEVNYD